MENGSQWRSVDELKAMIGSFSVADLARAQGGDKKLKAAEAKVFDAEVARRTDADPKFADLYKGKLAEDARRRANNRALDLFKDPEILAFMGVEDESEVAAPAAVPGSNGENRGKFEFKITDGSGNSTPSSSASERIASESPDVIERRRIAADMMDSVKGDPMLMNFMEKDDETDFRSALAKETPVEVPTAAPERFPKTWSTPAELKAAVTSMSREDMVRFMGGELDSFPEEKNPEIREYKENLRRQEIEILKAEAARRFENDRAELDRFRRDVATATYKWLKGDQDLMDFMEDGDRLEETRRTQAKETMDKFKESAGMRAFMEGIGFPELAEGSVEAPDLAERRARATEAALALAENAPEFAAFVERMAREERKS